MSTSGKVRALTPRAIQRRKGQQPIACLTAYTTPMAKLLDPELDLLLVGDSLGMVIYGLESTVGVTVEMMVAHGQAVMRGAEHACVVVDLPFGSYEESPQQAFRTASRIMRETGCAAVKLEGGVAMAETVRFLTRRGIPVMGHIGLTPQAIHMLGGYGVQGRSAEQQAQIREDAAAIAEAGAFAIVLEKVLEPLARQITSEVPVPTIGIGASPACDGQVLVTDDLLGLFPDFRPKFVKVFAELGEQVQDAVRAYAAQVRARTFPADEHTFAPAPNRKLNVV